MIKLICNGCMKKGEPAKVNLQRGGGVASRKQKENQVTKAKRRKCSKKEGMVTTFTAFERYKTMST